MTMFAREDRSDLLRWIFSGALVLVAHGGLAAAMVQWHEQEESAELGGAIVIDLSPVPVAPMENSAAPAPEQVEAEVTPEQPVEKIEEQNEEKVEEKIEQHPNPEVTLAVQQPEPKPDAPEPVEMKESKPILAEPAPLQAETPVAQTQSVTFSNALPFWKTAIADQLERNKRYPADARNRRQQGMVQLAFSIDREGRVITSRIVTSSGSSLLDKEALDLAQRASPFPPPPPELRGEQISLTVPIKFNIK